MWTNRIPSQSEYTKPPVFDLLTTPRVLGKVVDLSARSAKPFARCVNRRTGRTKYQACLRKRNLISDRSYAEQPSWGGEGALTF